LRGQDVHEALDLGKISDSSDEAQDRKAVWKLLPFYGYYIVYWGIYSQMSTTFFNQGCEMDLNVGSTTIPVAGLNLVDTCIIVLVAPFFDKVVYPLVNRVATVTPLRKIGFGFFFSLLSMVTAGILEIERLKVFNEGKFAGNSVCSDADENIPQMVDLSIFWQSPQFFFLGVSEVLASITALNFFYSEAPKSMKSICAALNMLTICLGTWCSAILIPLVNLGSSPWIGNDANSSHLDHYFFLLAGFMMINILIFLYSACNYQYVTPPKAREDEPLLKPVSELDVQPEP